MKRKTNIEKLPKLKFTENDFILNIKGVGKPLPRAYLEDILDEVDKLKVKPSALGRSKAKQ
jgi:hypothetical protein